MSITELVAFFVCTDIVSGAIIGGVYAGFSNGDPVQMVIGGVVGLGVGIVTSIAYCAFQKCMDFMNELPHQIQAEPTAVIAVAAPSQVIHSPKTSIKNSLTLAQQQEASEGRKNTPPPSPRGFKRAFSI